VASLACAWQPRGGPLRKASLSPNTFLPTGDYPPGEGFFQWRRFSQEVPEFNAGEITQMMSATRLAPEVTAAYAAPFPG